MFANFKNICETFTSTACVYLCTQPQNLRKPVEKRIRRLSVSLPFVPVPRRPVLFHRRLPRQPLARPRSTTRRPPRPCPNAATSLPTPTDARTRSAPRWCGPSPPVAFRAEGLGVPKATGAETQEPTTPPHERAAWDRKAGRQWAGLMVSGGSMSGNVGPGASQRRRWPVKAAAPVVEHARGIDKERECGERWW